MRRRCYVFGPYRLDPVARTVVKGDAPVALTPKAVETLIVLAEHNGAVVSKDTLLNRVWAGTFVADGSLMRNISDLRKALNVEGRSDFIDTVPKRGYRLNADVEEVEAPTNAQRRSVAVLPLRVIGSDPRDPAMAGAIAEAVVTKLSAVRECTVRSTGAVVRTPDDDPTEVGREVATDLVVDGSIRRSHEKIRVSVRLLPTAGGPALWAETVEERCDDAFACEDSISDELAGALALILTGAARRLLARRYTENAAAYQTYLKGRLQWAMRSQDGLHRAIDWFRRAIELDSEYAPAYSALANCYGLMPMIAPVASATFMPRAKAAALHALEIDDTLLEARSVLAFVNWHYDWNWKGAERELKRMLKGAPDDAVPRVWYALLLAERGDVGDAIAEARRAQALDPASGGVRANVATVLHFCGRHEEAIDEASNAIAVDAGSLRAHLIRGLALEQRNCGGEASAALETAVAVSRGLNPAALGALGHVCARVGNNGGVDKALRMLDKLPGEVTAFAKALVQIALGNNREALRLLQRAVESREFYLVMLGVDRRLDPIRQRPDFRALVERVGL